MKIIIELTSVAQLRALDLAIGMYVDVAQDSINDKDSGFTKEDLAAAKQICAMLQGDRGN